ncbi:MAG: ISAzo13 family transposase, partial [Promethearchaeota archaeon]
INPSNLPPDRIRKEGGGRKRSEQIDPTLKSDLLQLVSPDTRGDPQSSLRWSSKSLTKIKEALHSMNNDHTASVFVIRRLLREEGYSLQCNRKVKEGGDHPDRDLQFQNIAATTEKFMNDHEPVISIDAKKKELIGNFKNRGQEWNPKNQPTQVNVYDFRPKGGIKAVPYGIYDIAQNSGYINLGISADTAVFAGRSILKWWKEEGNRSYPNATKLLITADGGGSNGTRVRLWKVILQELANRLKIPITMCHYPPGTSKWNKIEHRLFSHITLNWRGVPLDSLRKMFHLISNTTTKKGLKVKCRLDLTEYEKGIKIPNKMMESLNIERQMFHGEWNYTIYPKIEQVILS